MNHPLPKPSTLLLTWICVGCSGQSGPPVETPAPPAPAQQWTAVSSNGTFSVTIGPTSGTVLLNKFQAWHLRLTDTQGEPVFPARFAIGGGMLGHGHGLPTQPKVTDYDGEGQYLVEGMKFNMAGDWTLYLAIESRSGSDQAKIDIKVDY